LPFYSDIPVGLPEVLRDDYDLVKTFNCLEPGSKPDPIFEPQDAFFLPVARLHGIARPGPEIYVYRRKSME
jgi:hypothetical protein